MIAVRNFPGTLSVGKNRHCPSGATFAERSRPSRLHTVAENGSSKSVRGRARKKPAASSRVSPTARRQILFFDIIFDIFYISLVKDMRTPPYPTQSYLKKRTMKPFRAALFALIVLLSAACSRPASDIVESSTNGLSGVRMPVQVTLREGVELAEDDLEDAVSFTPSADVEVSRLGVRTLRIVPKSPLKSDTRYKVALDASKLTGGKAKGVAEFEFSTPKLRFSYNPCWLQQSDDLKYYVLVGETVSSDYAADDYVEQRLKIKGLLKPEVTWTHSEDGTVHKYRVENIPTRSDESYKLTLDFDLDPKRNVEMEVPRKGEYIVLDHTVQTEPLAVVVTFSEPLKPNQDFRNLIRVSTRNSGPRSTGTASTSTPKRNSRGTTRSKSAARCRTRRGAGSTKATPSPRRCPRRPPRSASRAKAPSCPRPTA